MLNIGDASLSGGGEYLRTAVWDASKTILEEWTKVELSPSSLYGIRVYTDGAVLAPHVDRMPLVISAIINIAQDVDEEWPLEVYGHDGRAYNLTMGVGDMVLYESHSIIHGRPFPLVGRSYAVRKYFVLFQITRIQRADIVITLIIICSWHEHSVRMCSSILNLWAILLDTKRKILRMSKVSNSYTSRLGKTNKQNAKNTMMSVMHGLT